MAKLRERGSQTNAELSATKQNAGILFWEDLDFFGQMVVPVSFVAILDKSSDKQNFLGGWQYLCNL